MVEGFPYKYRLEEGLLSVVLAYDLLHHSPGVMKEVIIKSATQILRNVQSGMFASTSMCEHGVSNVA